MNSYKQTDNDISPNKDSLEVVGGLFSNYLERFKVIPSSTLFELTAQEKIKLLKEKRCLTCGTKLYQMRNLKWLCKSKKHKDSKVYSNEVIMKYE